MASLKIALSVDANNPDVGDLYLENGTVRLTGSLSEEVAQELFTRFKMFKGEWFLDTTAGIPYFQQILGIKTPLSIVAQIFQNVITKCPGVKSLDSFRLAPIDSSRASTLQFSCTLIDGSSLSESDFVDFVIPGGG